MPETLDAPLGRDEESAKDFVKGREGSWAAPVAHLKVTQLPAGAIALNLEGRAVVGPLQGFGPMWQRTYRVRLSGIQVSPEEVVRDWKQKLPHFMPPNAKFYPSLTGIRPGEFIFINTTLPLAPGTRGIIPMKSGVLVLYADRQMFTVMTPEGFPISGWNSFSAYEEDGATVAQVQGLIRTSDPIYEFGFSLMGGEREEDRVWFHVLTQLAQRWGVKGEVQFHKVLIDPKPQWKYASNVWKNAAIRTFLYVLGTPVRAVGNWLKR